MRTPPRQRADDSCPCIKQKVQYKRQTILDIGSERIHKLNAKDRNLHKRLVVLKALKLVNRLPAKTFQKQLLAVCPEMGVCLHTGRNPPLPEIRGTPAIETTTTTTAAEESVLDIFVDDDTVASVLEDLDEF